MLDARRAPLRGRSSTRSLLEYSSFYNASTGNFVNNSDFSQGSRAFNSSLRVTDLTGGALYEPLPERACAVAPSSNATLAAWASCGDHTTQTRTITGSNASAALFCRGGGVDSSDILWTMTTGAPLTAPALPEPFFAAVNVSGSATYRFSAYLLAPSLPASGAPLPVVVFEVAPMPMALNGSGVIGGWVTLGNATAANATCAWTAASFVYTTFANATSLLLRLRAGVSSNGVTADVAIDDVYFQRVWSGGGGGGGGVTSGASSNDPGICITCAWLIPLCLLLLLGAAAYAYYRLRPKATAAVGVEMPPAPIEKPTLPAPVIVVPVPTPAPIEKPAVPAPVISPPSKPTPAVAPPIEVAPVATHADDAHAPEKAPESGVHLERAYVATVVPRFAGGGVVLHGGKLGNKTKDSVAVEGHVFGDAKLNHAMTAEEKLARAKAGFLNEKHEKH